MKHTKTWWKIRLLALLCGAGVAGISSAAHAVAPIAAIANQEEPKSLPPVTLDLRDAPVRSALEQLFNTVKVDFAVDANVAGFVTLKVSDKPFDNALRLILRSASTPLTYTVEDGVYIVRLRRIESAGAAGPVGPPAPEAAPFVAAASGGRRMEQIELVYADPFDLAGVLGITLVPIGTRGGQGGGNGTPGLANGAMGLPNGNGAGLGNGLGANNGSGLGNGSGLPPGGRR